jgi:capsular polysaccharide biosynthesis protein
MAGEVFKQITALMQQHRLADAIRACEAELIARDDPKSRQHVVSALCLCLTEVGREADAAAVYTQHRGDFHAHSNEVFVTAALAVRHTADIQKAFRIRSGGLYMGQPIGFSSLATLAAWSARAGIAPLLIDPPQQVVPAAAGRPPYAVDPYYCFQIPEGEFVSGFDFAFAPGGVFLADSSYMVVETFYGVFPYVVAPSLNRIAHVWPEDVEDIPEDVLFLSSPRAFHVGHFIVDFLPRLRSLAMFGPHVKVALPREAPVKFIDLLELFGITRDRIIFCDLGKRYRFRTLIVAQVGRLQRPNPKNMHFLRATFAPKESRVSDVRGYFFDRSIGTRQIVNQQEVDEVLAAFKIRHINLEALSIAQQRDAMSQAQVLVGTYGSDLLACLFAPAGAHAIELTWGETDRTAEWCLRSGLHHQYLMCEAPAQSSRQRMKKDRDMRVDCNELRARLTAIFSTRRLRD